MDSFIDHLRYLLSFDDPGAEDDHLAKGVTVGDIRMWHDEIERLQGALLAAEMSKKALVAELVDAASLNPA
jgi:hypothetical protein